MCGIKVVSEDQGNEDRGTNSVMSWKYLKIL